MGTVNLDLKIMKALSSEVRVAILRQLYNRPMTVSELSASLNMPKSTLHENLKKLVETNLITKRVNSNQYVYYKMTPKSKDIFNPENDLKISISQSIFIILVMSSFSIGSILLNNAMRTAGGPQLINTEHIIVLIFLLSGVIVYIYWKWRLKISDTLNR